MIHLLIRRLTVTCVFLLLAAPALPAQRDAATEAYFAANALYNKKLYDLAADEYRAFIARYPGHGKILHARLGLALALYERQQFGEAEPILAELAHHPDSPHKVQVHNLWGQCLLIANRPAEAEKAFRWSVNRGKENLFLELPGVAQQFHEAPQISMASVTDLEPLERGLAGLSEALFQQRKWSEVVTQAEEMAELVPEGRFATRVLFLKNLALYELKEHAQAAGELKSYLENFPESPFTEYAHFLLAECHRELNDLDDAALHHETVARKLRGNFAANALFRLGHIRFLQKEYARAVRDLGDLISLYPDSPYGGQAGLLLGRSLLELERYGEAQEQFGALSGDPEVAAEATLWLGRTLLRSGDPARAEDVLRPAIRRFASSEHAQALHFALANAILGQERYAESSEAFAEAVNAFPESNLTPEALRLQAISDHQQGDYAASLRTCERFLQEYREHPRQPSIAFLSAENRFFQGELEEAIAAYRQFIPWEGKGEHTDQARFRILQAQVQREAWTSALDEAEALFADRPEGPEYADLDYLAGLCRYNLKEDRHAIDAFERFTSEYPERPNAAIALMKLSRAYERSGDPAGARESLLSLIANYPQSEHLPHALAEAGRLLYDSGEYALARRHLARIASEFRQSDFLPQAEYYLGWISLSEEKAAEAIEHFTRVVQYFPEHPLAGDAQFQQATLYFKEGDWGRSEAAFGRYQEQYAADGNRSDQASFFRGVSLARSGDYQAAIEPLSTFAGSYPSSSLLPRALYEAAWCARNLSDLDTAAKHYSALLEAAPFGELAETATLELAGVRYEQSQYDASIELVDNLLARDIAADTREKALYRSGWALLGREQPRAAADAFERLVREYPASELTPVAAYQAGEIRLEEKQFQRAYEHFLKAVEAPRTSEVSLQAQLRLGETQTLTGRWSDAAETFTTYLRENPQSGFERRANLWLGWSLENLKQYDRAIRHYTAVLESGQRDELAARAQFQVGECHYASHRYDEAIKALVQVDTQYAFESWSSRALLELGQVLESKGQPSQAMARYREVAERFPDRDEAMVARDLLRDNFAEVPTER